MKLYDLLQWLIVASAVLVSGLYAIGRVAPNLRGRCAAWLQRAQQPSWMKNIGAKIAGSAGGCGDGCDTCGSCAPQQDASTLPVKILNKAPLNR